MARTPDQPTRSKAAEIVRLTQDAHAAALLLAARCSRAWACDRRLSLDEADGLTIDERIDAGDREAIYDALVNAVGVLAHARDEIGRLLSDGTDALAALTEQETAGTDAGGKERARGIARTAGMRPPARHG